MVTDRGVDVTSQFLRGAQEALTTCKELNIESAYLKERSPSCGVACTHVANQLTEGPGVTTACLQRAGIEVHGIEGRRRVELEP